MDLNEKTLESALIYDGKIINLRNDRVLLPNGNESFREVVKHPGGVCVVPLCEDGSVIFVKQFRYPYDIGSTGWKAIPWGRAAFVRQAGTKGGNRRSSTDV